MLSQCKQRSAHGSRGEGDRAAYGDLMDFTVTTHDGIEREFRGDSSYRLKDGGVLEVTDRQSGRTRIFGPHGWLSVEHATQEGKLHAF